MDGKPERLRTPIAFFVFKRPELTARVVQAIVRAKPTQLYVVADGPRNSAEERACRLTRRAIDDIEWDCAVYRDYSEVNLGVRNRIISGLDWVFAKEERAIILEDDCIPDASFFPFCEQLLNYHQDDQRIMHISGDNFLFGRRPCRESYFFSKYAHVWGWATWRRAWALFHSWDSRHPPLDYGVFSSDSEKAFWSQLLEQVCANELTYTWDYQWSLVCLAHRALCIMPIVNLVANIGFGEEATNTRGDSSLANLPTREIRFPLVHPRTRQWNAWADEQAAQLFFHAPPRSFFSKLRSLVARGSRRNEM